jgi:plastocyanin
MVEGYRIMPEDDPVNRRRRPELSIIAAASILLVGVVAFAAAVHQVIQKDRAFSVGEITIARGERLDFDNEDEFIHQIYIASPDMTFDSAEQPPGQIVSVQFTRTGTFPVRCHIHPKMALTVHVQ